MTILCSVMSLSYADDFEELSISKPGTYTGNYGEGIKGLCFVDVLKIEKTDGFLGFGKKLSSLIIRSNLFQGDVTVTCNYYGIGERSCRAKLDGGFVLNVMPGVVFYDDEHTDYKLPSISVLENNKILQRCVDLQLNN